VYQAKIKEVVEASSQEEIEKVLELETELEAIEKFLKQFGMDKESIINQSLSKAEIHELVENLEGKTAYHFN